MFDNSETAFNAFESLLADLTKEDTIVLDLALVAGEYNGTPSLLIEINNELLLSKELINGKHQFNISHNIKDKKELCIEISMSGKGPRDTKVENGKIVEDKFILIESLKINGYDITNDFDLFRDKLQYRDNNTGKNTPVLSGFWSNSTLTLNCQLPFSIWYSKNSLKNIELSSPLHFRDDKIQADSEFQKIIKAVNLIK